MKCTCNLLWEFGNFQSISLQSKHVPKICIKYRKHWKSCMGFQLPGQTRPFLAVLKKTLGADYDQLFRKVFSCFQGQKNILNLFWKYFSIRTKQLHSSHVRKNWKKMRSILFWVKIGYSHTIECMRERRTRYLIQIFAIHISYLLQLVNCSHPSFVCLTPLANEEKKTVWRIACRFPLHKDVF